MKNDHWLIVVSVLVLAALAGVMHLHTVATAQAARIVELESAAALRAAEDASALVLLPPVDAAVSSPAGWRVRPMGGGESGFHQGTDFACPIGTPVRASAAGVVTVTYPVPGTPVPGRPGVFYRGEGELGATVQVDHGNGLWTKYGHLSRVDVRAGQRVEAGEQIALSGNTGVSTGPHLHWQGNMDLMRALRWRMPR